MPDEISVVVVDAFAGAAGAADAIGPMNRPSVAGADPTVSIFDTELVAVSTIVRFGTVLV